MKMPEGLAPCRLFFMLKTGAGTAAVGGPRMLIPSCPPTAAFASMPLAQREAILQYWSTSPIPLLRKVQIPLWRQE